MEKIPVTRQISVFPNADTYKSVEPGESGKREALM